MKKNLVVKLMGMLCLAGVGIGMPHDSYLPLPGTLIAQSPNFATSYIGTPSIAILPDGSLVASHDSFGPSALYTVMIYRSTNRGGTWLKTAEFPGQWSNLFVHQGQLYAMGTSSIHGNIVIRRSIDGGLSWTIPTNSSNGLLRSGTFHTSAVPMVIHQGRIWRAFEDVDGVPGWPSQYRAFLMSAPIDSDLLKAANWAYTAKFQSSGSWLNAKFNGWLEGNITISPNGHLVDILRTDTVAGMAEKAALIDFGPDAAQGTFQSDARPDLDASQSSGFIDFPGGSKKFTIRQDASTGHYWTLSNVVLPQWSSSTPSLVRNTVALMSSSDMVHWEIRCYLFFLPDIQADGLQYLDWNFDGDSLVAVSRTALKAVSAHNANFLTFHRIEHFRNLNLADSVPTTGNRVWRFPGIEATCSNSTLGFLETGLVAFTNRSYTWDDVPLQFANSLVTRVDGGGSSSLHLFARENTRAYIASMSSTGFAGWICTGFSFCYTDTYRTRFRIYRRDLNAGEEAQVSQVGWGGTLLIVPPSTSPVGWWCCESSYNDTACADEQYSFHGALSQPAPSAVSAFSPSGNAFRFQTSQHVDLGNNFGLTRCPFTIAFWMRTDVGDLQEQVPLSKMETGSSSGYAFELNSLSATGRIRFMTGSVAGELTSQKQLNDGSWHHIAVTQAPGQNRILYVDGVEESRCPAQEIAATTASLRFGARTSGGNAVASYKGWLDDIRIYHNALDDVAVRVLANNLNITPNPVNWEQPNLLLRDSLSPQISICDGLPRISWVAVSGHNYKVFRSTTMELNSWSLVATITAQGALGEFIDRSMGLRAFYIVQPSF